MKQNNALIFSMLILFLYGCTNSGQEKRHTEGIVIDFKNPEKIKSSEIITEYEYIKLETLDDALLGAINKIEIYNDRIYILDTYKANSIFVFSMQGKFIAKLEAGGNGPGQFISPHSFKIDTNGYLYILDRMSSKLLKYQTNDLKFVENIPLPYPSPLSFSTIAQTDLFVYYYPLRKNENLRKQQMVIADRMGKVVKTLYDGGASGKILHGNPNNIYFFENEIRIYPYFTNKIYSLEKNNTLRECYNLSWGKLTMPEEELFEKYESSGEIMKRIWDGDNNWIRLLYVYETESVLAVKYYIKQDFYLSYWNKHTGNTVNTKAKSIVDDLGLGDSFPLPIGIYGEKMIGVIPPFEVKNQQVKDEKLLSLLENMTEESNPVLIFYNLK